MKTAIVSDSTAYIPQEICEQYDIHIIPLSVVFADETYREIFDISNQDFYDRMRNASELPTTTQPPIGMFVSMYEKLAEDYDAVISIHLSSGISGTYQGAVSAAGIVDTIKVYPYDSELACMIQGFYALEAAKMAREGKGPEEILARLDEMKANTRAYFMVDDLTNLKKGGRLSGVSATVGDLLQIKPLLHFVDKVIVPYELVRTRKKALNKIIKMFEEDAAKGVPLYATVLHANRKEEAEKILADFQEKYPHVEFILSEFGPVIGTHLGEGAMGIGWIKK